MTGGDLRRDAVVLACAISAGVHGALVPGHLAESAAAGAGFAVSAAALAALAVLLTYRPGSAAALTAAAATFAGLLAAYLLAATTGLPLLHPRSEPVDALGLVTKAVEAAGLLAAASLLRRPRAAGAPFLLPKGA